MKQVIVDENLKEVEVHPPGFYQQFVDICATSAVEMLKQTNEFIEVTCPACDSPDREPAFEKYGYTYWVCHRCATIFVSARPSKALLDWYLLASPVAEFRASHEYRQTMAQRTRELALYRTEWISELASRLSDAKQCPIVDVGTRSLTYLTELSQRRDEPIMSIKPLMSTQNVAVSADNLITILNDWIELTASRAKIVTLFDVLEHQFSPFDLISSAYTALEPGGLLVITTRSGSGFDIQILWGQANIFPAEHINLISVEGIRTLLDMVGFEILEESTPGQLDVQLIERILNERKDANVPRFLKYFLSYRDRYAKQRLQQFLQQNLLSSYLRVVARKPMSRTLDI